MFFGVGLGCSRTVSGAAFFQCLVQSLTFITSFILVLFRHPHLSDPFSLSNPSPRYLLSLHRLLTLVPSGRLPIAWSVVPARLVETMKSDPVPSTRLLAWRIVRKWAGIFDGTGEDLRHKWVYTPDAPGDGLVSQSVPPPLDNDEEGYTEKSGENWWLDWNEEIVEMKEAEGSLVACVRRRKVDGWLLAIAEEEGHYYARRNRPVLPALEEDVEGGERLSLAESNLSPWIASVYGIMLLRESSITGTIAPPIVDDTFVSTSAARLALRQLAIHVSSRSPTLLSSPPGAGKTVVLRQLSRILQAPNPVVISLSSPSMSASSLLGSLATSPQDPGRFVFQEGALTRALRLGRWVVLRDVDRAPEDVLVLVGDLAERMRKGATVGVTAGGQWVSAAHGFMLFATRSTVSEKKFWGEHNWCPVAIPEPTFQERQAIVRGVFALEGVTEQLLAVWERVRNVKGKGKQIGFGDLMRFVPLCLFLLVDS
jgi:midasin